MNRQEDSDHEVRTTFGGNTSITAEDIMEAQRKAEQKIRDARDAAAREAGYQQDNGGRHPMVDSHGVPIPREPG